MSAKSYQKKQDILYVLGQFLMNTLQKCEKFKVICQNTGSLSTLDPQLSILACGNKIIQIDRKRKLELSSLSQTERGKIRENAKKNNRQWVEPLH